LRVQRVVCAVCSLQFAQSAGARIDEKRQKARVCGGMQRMVGTGSCERRAGNGQTRVPQGWSTARSTFVRASPWSASSHCMPHPCRNFLSRHLSRARPRRRCEQERERGSAGAQEQRDMSGETRRDRRDKFESHDACMVLRPCCSYCLPLPRPAPPARQSPCRRALRAAGAYDCAYCLSICEHTVHRRICEPQSITA
jgi:hypothetical protein